MAEVQEQTAPLGMTLGIAMQRRLAAILAADVVGYSRLMGADEMGTHTSLKLHRRELIDSGIAEHHGRIVKTTGDGMLVEFASVVDAVGCAVSIQRSMVRRNVGIAAEKQIVFRIGINVGDIIIDGDDIFGDGVNIAARLETLCEPGGVCSGTRHCRVSKLLLAVRRHESLSRGPSDLSVRRRYEGEWFKLCRRTPGSEPVYPATGVRKPDSSAPR